jgi:cold shock CspA family protein
MDGVFRGWLPDRRFGFIAPDDGSPDVFLHISKVSSPNDFRSGAHVTFKVEDHPKGRKATTVAISPVPGQSQGETDPSFPTEDIEELDTAGVDQSLLNEMSQWKREAKAENNDRYFWHVREVDQIARGDKYFVIGRKGAGKTAICEYFSHQKSYDIFPEKLNFKNFPFNELYSHKNQKYTVPNQFITIWKYLIYSTVCRSILKNESVDSAVRGELATLYDDDSSLSRRLTRWVGKEFGLSLFGLSVKIIKSPHGGEPIDWTEHVNYLEDILLKHAGTATYFVLFDELDEDYRDVIQADQYHQYTALITSLFKAVQDVRLTMAGNPSLRIFPVIFLRDDIYELVQDSDKNKWGDFRVDLNWDSDKIKKVMAFRISRALDPHCQQVLPFDLAWSKAFGTRPIGIGKGNKKISTFDYIARSTLLRPRDFVAYLQNCARHAIENNGAISPEVVKIVDKAFSNYLREELTDELFAILPDIANIFDAISQLRKWNFSIPELERAYQQQVDRGFIKERNVKFVLQVLFLFSVIGNTPRTGRFVFRYQNREARLNFNERVVVHRGLFKALQIL